MSVLFFPGVASFEKQNVNFKSYETGSQSKPKYSYREVNLAPLG